jgi:hypothetical protein
MFRAGGPEYDSTSHTVLLVCACPDYFCALICVSENFTVGSTGCTSAGPTLPVVVAVRTDRQNFFPRRHAVKHLNGGAKNKIKHQNLHNL